MRELYDKGLIDCRNGVIARGMIRLAYALEMEEKRAEMAASIWPVRKQRLAAQFIDAGHMSPSSDDIRRQLSTWSQRMPILRGVYEVEGLSNQRFAACFSPDGKRVLFINGANYLLCEVETGKKLGTVPHRHGRPIAFSPDGKYFFAGQQWIDLPAGPRAREPRARLYDGFTAAPVGPQGRPVEGDGFEIGVAFSPDGKIIAIPTAALGTVTLRQTATQELVCEVGRYGRDAFSPLALTAKLWP